MTSTSYYYCNNQIRSYTVQFMAVFANMQVRVGKLEDIESRLISVPIHYGHADRIVAAILADNTQVKPVRLPVMSAVIKGIKLSQERMKGQLASRRNSFVPVGGLVPDDIKVVHQHMPVPYDLNMELAIWASNTDQHFQILEQIFVMFDPQLTIQKSDGAFDWTRMTQITLDDISLDVNYPIGTDRRIVRSSLSFTMPIWISAPADIRRDIIEKIFVRIGAVSVGDATNYDIVAELDAQGIEYEEWFNSDNINFQ